jgi:membrane protein
MGGMGRTSWIIFKQAWLSYTRHNVPQLAAAISYYVLFAILPIAVLTVSIFGFFLGSQELRNDIVNRILDIVPLTQSDGRDAVVKAVNSINRVSGPAAALGLIGTVWTASAVFASIRKALNIVWGAEEHRPFVQAKLVDLTQVGGLGVFLLASVVLTGVLRALRSASTDHVGPLAGHNPLWEVPALLIPAVLTLLAFIALYHIVPAVHPSWRDVLPGAALATLLFEGLKNTFAFYVANFNNLDRVYGSLAGAFLFLFFVYLAGNILLIGAELSRSLQRYRAGEFDAEIHPTEPPPPMTARAMQAIKSLFVKEVRQG